MTESKIEAKIVAALEDLGCWVIRIQGRGVNGIPDLIVHRRGHTLYLEDKTPKGRLSAHQIQFRERAEAQMIPCKSARSVEEAIQVVIKEFGITNVPSKTHTAPSQDRVPRKRQ